MSPVRIEGLSKHYGQVLALQDVSLQIKAGELFFLLGPSGCGKTTLLRCVAGFCEPDAGRIWLGEQEITHLPANRRDTAMVFQNYALWPHMSVAQNVAFGLEVRQVSLEKRRQEVLEALRLVEMAPLAERKPNELSGGQQQRVALARALVVKPRCLLLDEPLSNLDAKLRLQMRRQIRRLCKQLRLTTIYVTHDQKEALSMADRIAVLRDGRIEQVDTPTELYNKPTNRFVAAFVGETNFIQAEVTGQKDGVWMLRTPAGVIRSTAARVAPPQGAGVTVSIRPEAVRFAGGPSAEVGFNRFVGTLAETVYLGEVAQHEVQVAETVSIKVLQLHPKTLPAAPGEPVQIEFDPAETVILTE
ncbi:MAG: ABC transporter ATP-binding protein [Phycisphaerae bacterium]